MKKLPLRKIKIKKQEPSLQLKKLLEDIDDIITNRIDRIDIKLLNI